MNLRHLSLAGFALGAALIIAGLWQLDAVAGLIGAGVILVLVSIDAVR